MIYDTVNTIGGHREHGYHALGTGPQKVMILGSCRVLPYVNYFNFLNADNRFTIYLVNVVNFSFDEGGNSVDGAVFTQQFEDNAQLRDALAGCEWLICEHTTNYGMFNTDAQREKNIFKFGMRTDRVIAIPNFNDIFILFQELINFDEALRERARREIAATGELSPEFQEDVTVFGLRRIRHFLEIVGKGSLPEFADLFAKTWRSTRYWWTGNHVSNAFTATVFNLLNEKFLRLPLPDEVQSAIYALDMYSSPASPITQYDVDNYGLTWPQPVADLVIP